MPIKIFRNLRNLSLPSSPLICLAPNLISRTTKIISFSKFKKLKDKSWKELVRMFTNNQRQEERTGKHGTPRLQYLQELVSQFQNATDEVTKERIVANLANFAYDPYNYTILRQLNVLELFIDCITEPNEKLVEFGIGGICNACAEPKNVATIAEADGIPLIIKCLSSPVRNTVNYALGALYYMCDYNRATRKEIMRAEVVELIKRYAAAESVSVSFSNLATAFLDKHVHANT